MMRIYIFSILYCTIIVSSSTAQLKEKADSLQKSFESSIRYKYYNHPSAFRLSSSKINSTDVLDSSLVQEWDNNQWQFRQLFNYSYSSDLKEETELLRKFENNEWVNVIRTSKTYNDWHDLLWEQVEIFSNNEWEYVQQKFITYKQMGGISEELYQVWNNGWENRTRYTAIYDENNTQTELLIEDWNGAWQNSYRYIFTIDVINKTNKVVEQYWNGQWQNMKQNITNYNDSKTLFIQTYYQWENGDWKPVDQIFSTYNENKELLEIILLKWQIGGWENATRESYVYSNINGLLDSVIFQSWNAGDSLWENEAKDFYLYDNFGLTSEIIFYHWIDSQWISSFRNLFEDQVMVKKQTSQYWENGQWVNQRMETHFYKLVVSVDKDKQELLSYQLDQNYPNPFNPISHFGFRISESGHVEIKVYDNTGRQVAVLMNEEKSAGEYTIRFDASSFASGVYFYTLKAGSFQSTKKMILQK